MSRAVMQQALDAIDHLCNTTAAGRYYEPKIVGDAIKALEAALAEPQTTHWEGCEAVHPECKEKKK